MENSTQSACVHSPHYKSVTTPIQSEVGHQGHKEAAMQAQVGHLQHSFPQSSGLTVEKGLEIHTLIPRS